MLGQVELALLASTFGPGHHRQAVADGGVLQPQEHDDATAQGPGTNETGDRPVRPEQRFRVASKGVFGATTKRSRNGAGGRQPRSDQGREDPCSNGGLVG